MIFDFLMKTYSHSRLSTFEQCPLKFKFQYIDKIEKAEESVEAFMGKRVHEVLEKLYEKEIILADRDLVEKQADTILDQAKENDSGVQ